MISVRPSVRPSGCNRKLNVGLISYTMLPIQIKLCMIITTMALHTPIPLLVTFDLYYVTGSAYVQNEHFQYLKNCACQRDETWYRYKGHQLYVTYTSFVRPLWIQGQIIDVHWNLSETLMLGLFRRLWYRANSNLVWLWPLLSSMQLYHCWWPLTFI